MNRYRALRRTPSNHLVGQTKARRLALAQTTASKNRLRAKIRK
jgi:hypothetical protein